MARTIVLFFLVSAGAFADSPIIYRLNPIGSAATFNPVSHYLNLAFDTAQNPTYFSQSRYFTNHGVLFDRIKDPFQAIEDAGGWRQFLSDEFVGLRAIPNYPLHVIGGGYDYRWLAEWYSAHDVPYPYLFAFVNSYLGNLGNEAIETTATVVKPTDHVADLFFFDVAGKLLFMNDDVARFFHETLQMRGWHMQPMLSFRELHIENAGSNYVLRPKLFGDTYRPFFHVGLVLMAGLSYRVSGGDSLTLAGGVTPTDPLNFKGDPIVGLYWDREDALLASLTLNGSSRMYGRLNVYPDAFSIREARLGWYLAYSKAKELFVGVNFVFPAGLGY